MYIIRDGEMLQATHDHNYHESLCDLLRSGKITQEQYESERERFKALTSYIGMGGVKLYDISKAPLTLKDGDTLLLTSDGLYNSVSAEQLQGCFREDAAETAQNLIEQFKASKASCRDNTTFIIIRYHQEDTT